MNAELGSDRLHPPLPVEAPSEILATLDPDQVADVFRLWDELSAFGAGEAAASKQHLLTRLCALVGAKNADWIGCVRMPDGPPDDPLFGWRPRSLSVLHPDKEIEQRIGAAFDQMDIGRPDVTTTRNAELAGSYRVLMLQDLAPDGWFQERAYREFYVAIDRLDSIWAAIPVNAEAELFLGLHRGFDQPAFTRAEARLVNFALRGLSWFYRQQMISDGIGIASSSLTPKEHKVLAGLLKGLSESNIAHDIGQSPHTTHDHVKRIFRKYGVSSRSELMALWLGRPPRARG